MLASHRFVPLSLLAAGLLLTAGLAWAETEDEDSNVFILTVNDGQAETHSLDGLEPGESRETYTANGERLVITHELDGYSFEIGDRRIVVPTLEDADSSHQDIEILIDGEDLGQSIDLRTLLDKAVGEDSAGGKHRVRVLQWNEGGSDPSVDADEEPRVIRIRREVHVDAESDAADAPSEN